MPNDYISRETAIEVLCGHCQDIDYGEDEDTCWCMKKDRLNQIPAADVRPVKRGKWERPEDSTTRSWIFVCSKCRDRAYFPVPKYFPKNGCGYNFCPNCGADMRGEGGSVYVAEPLQAQPQEKKTKNVIHLWMEGYDCNGDHAGPSRCGVYEAETLRDAVSMWANEKPDRWKYIKMDREPPDFWGCSFFDKKR